MRGHFQSDDRVRFLKSDVPTGEIRVVHGLDEDGVPAFVRHGDDRLDAHFSRALTDGLGKFFRLFQRHLVTAAAADVLFFLRFGKRRADDLFDRRGYLFFIHTLTGRVPSSPFW